MDDAPGSEASKRLITYAMLGGSLTPPGPPGPPRHTHDDGTNCQWVRRNGIDRWRRVDSTGWDQGPCPGLEGER